MSQEWTPPDDKTVARIRAMVRSDIEEGEQVGKLVDELVTEEGWPKEAAVSFVDQVEREGRARRRLRAPPRSDAPLQEHIGWYVRQGYRVVSQTETTAQLVKPKEFAFGWATFWFLMFGVGILVYIFYYMGKKDEMAYLVVGDAGKVKVT